MFSNKETKKEQAEISSASTQIMKGTTVEGNIETFGNVRIEGKIIGNVRSKSKIAIGDSSLIEGNIYSQNAEIAGEVKGGVEITELLILRPTAVIHGDINTGKLVVEAGAVFNGNCRMGSVVSKPAPTVIMEDTLNGKAEEQKFPVK